MPDYLGPRRPYDPWGRPLPGARQASGQRTPAQRGGPAQPEGRGAADPQWRARLSELEQALAAEQRRVAEYDAALAAERRRGGELQAALAEARQRAGKAEAALAAERRRSGSAVEAALGGQQRRLAELERALAAADERAAQHEAALASEREEAAERRAMPIATSTWRSGPRRISSTTSGAPSANAPTRARRRGSSCSGSYLPVLDDLERALEQVPDELQQHPWVEGMPLIARRLRMALAKAGVERIGACRRNLRPPPPRGRGLRAAAGLRRGADRHRRATGLPPWRAGDPSGAGDRRARRLNAEFLSLGLMLL